MSIKNLLRSRKGTGWLHDSVDERDWTYPKMGLAPLTVSPESVSLLPDVPRIYSQGATNSCVAQAIAGAIGICEHRTQTASVPASRLFLYYNSRAFHHGQRVDSGTYIRTCCKGLVNFGVPNEEYWKFSQSPLRVNRRPGWLPYMRGFQRKNGEYFRLSNFDADFTSQVKTTLSNGFPIVFGTKINRDFIKNSGPKIINKPNSSGDIIGGHAMVIIGYKEFADCTCYEVLNSWGDDWREKGVAFLTEEYIKWHATRDFTVIRGWDRIQGG